MTTTEGKQIGGTLMDVLLVPGLGDITLLSVSKLTDKGHTVTFSKKGSVLRLGDGNEVSLKKLTTGGSRRRLFVLPGFAKKRGHAGSENEVAMVTETAVDKTLMHRRLGHLHEDAMDQIFDFKGAELEFCAECALGKMARAAKPKAVQTRAVEPYEKLHMDLWTANKTAKDGCKYALVVVDDYSNFMWVAYLKNKSEVTDFMDKQFMPLFPLRSECNVLTIRTDRGGEFMGPFVGWANSAGIMVERSAPHSQWQNGRAERAWRTLGDTTRTMLLTAHLGPEFWALAMAAAVHLRNRVPSKAVNGKVPITMLTGEAPNLNYLKVFGCEAYVRDPARVSKLDAKARKGIFVGYPADGGKDCYKVLMQDTGKMVHSRDVVFNEDGFGGRGSCAADAGAGLPAALSFGGSGSGGQLPQPEIGAGWPVEGEQTDQQPLTGTTQEDEGEVHEDQQPPTDTTQGYEHEEQTVSAEPDDGSQGTQSGDEASTLEEELVPTTSSEDAAGLQTSSQSGVVAQQGNRFDLLSWSQNAELPQQVQQTQSEQPDQASGGRITRSSARGHRALVAQSKPDPRAPEWMEAKEAEMGKLEKHGTWELVRAGPGDKVLPSMFVFTEKRNPDDSVKEHKARLVVIDNSKSMSGDSVFSPVVGMETLNCALSCAALIDEEIERIDFSSAFIQSAVNEEVLVRPPKGYEEVDEYGRQLCYKLKKCLYGLQQAPRCFNEMLQKFLEHVGWEQSAVDPGLYTRVVGGEWYKVLVWVDDLILIGEDIEVLTTFKAELAETFEVKDLGPVKDMVGLEVQRNREQRTLKISLTKYTKDIIENFGMAECNAMGTPMLPNTKLVLDKSKESLDKAMSAEYRRLAGSLLYLASRARPDIAFAAVEVSRVCSHPTAESMVQAKRVLRYLQGTKDWGLTYGPGSGGFNTLVGYADADYAAGQQARSTSGYVFQLNGAPVSWGSKLQGPVAQATAEAEYYALGVGLQSGVHLRAILAALGHPQQATVVNEDNTSCISMSKNHIVSRRTKHIAVKYHFVRQKVREGEFVLRHCASSEMLADPLTKALAAGPHNYLCGKMMGYNNV
jgi:transposase InsO family protein